MEEIYGLWPEWSVLYKIGQGSFGSVYEIERNDFGNVMHSALKVLSVPQNPGDVEALVSEGMSEQEIQEYYQGVVMDLVEEFKLMAELRGNTNIVSYEDHKVVEHPDGIGCDILIRMELLTPFYTYMKQQGNDLYQTDVLRLGIDICRALEVCENYKIIHRDIKPENIFINNRGDFKLGDFGVAREMDKTVSMMSKKGTYSYMAPEVFLGNEYDATVDIYSLGIVLYRYFNEGRLPFVEKSGSISSEYRQNAMMRRIKGEPLPPPAQADPELARVILKACEYHPAARFRTAGEFRRNLESILENGKSLLSAEPNPGPADQDIYGMPRQIQDPYAYAAPQPKASVIPSMPQPGKPKKKSMAPLIAFLVISILALLGTAGYILWQRFQEDEDKSEASSVSTKNDTEEDTVSREPDTEVVVSADGTLVGNNYSFKLIKKQITAEILPEDTSGDYTYYSPFQEGMVYIDMEFTVNRTGDTKEYWDSLMLFSSITPSVSVTPAYIVSRDADIRDVGKDRELADPTGEETVHFALVVPESIREEDTIDVVIRLDGKECMVNIK